MLWVLQNTSIPCLISKEQHGANLFLVQIKWNLKRKKEMDKWGEGKYLGIVYWSVRAEILESVPLYSLEIFLNVHFIGLGIGFSYSTLKKEWGHKNDSVMSGKEYNIQSISRTNFLQCYITKAEITKACPIFVH